MCNVREFLLTTEVMMLLTRCLLLVASWHFRLVKEYGFIQRLFSKERTHKHTQIHSNSLQNTFDIWMNLVNLQHGH